MVHFLLPRQTVILLVVCLGASLLSRSASSETDALLLSNPETAVRAFYEAINSKDCQTATRIRKGYEPEKCEEINAITELKVQRRQYESEMEATVWLAVSYVRNKRKNSFCGYVRVTKQDDTWVIPNRGAYFTESHCEVVFDQKDEVVNERPVPYNRVEAPAPATRAKAGPGGGNLDSGTPPRSTPDNADLAANSLLPSDFGSAAILRSCWTTEQLLGDPRERTIGKLYPPDARPPLRFRPSPSSEPPPLAQSHKNSIRRVKPRSGRKLVALTFDLCEQADEETGYDGAIVDFLRKNGKNGIKATFFAGGKWLRTHPERAMQLMADPLFEVGNHAWTHGNLSVMRGAEAMDQLTWTQAQYEILWETLKNHRCVVEAGINEMERIPRLPRAFRFPYGRCRAESLAATAQLGLSAVQWDIVTSDSWRKQTPKGIVDRILKDVKPGSIVIFHANGRGRRTLQALKSAVPALQRRGYEFATVSEMLARGEPVTADSCYELKPGDNDHYDRLFGNGTGL